VAEFSQMADPFAQAREASFASMQADAWPRFIKHRLNLAQNMVYRTDLPGEVGFFIISWNDQELIQQTTERQ